MLGLYLYTLIISHKSCNMLGILNKLTVYKELPTFVTNNVFLGKKVKTQQQNKKSNRKPSPEPGIESGTSCTQSECVTTAPPSQLRLSIVVKQFNCFDVMGRNVNKQSPICGPDIFNKYIFCNIFTCMNNYIWQFLIFTGVGFAA